MSNFNFYDEGSGVTQRSTVTSANSVIVNLEGNSGPDYNDSEYEGVHIIKMNFRIAQTDSPYRLFVEGYKGANGGIYTANDWQYAQQNIGTTSWYSSGNSYYSEVPLTYYSMYGTPNDQWGNMTMLFNSGFTEHSGTIQSLAGGFYEGYPITPHFHCMTQYQNASGYPYETSVTAMHRIQNWDYSSSSGTYTNTTSDQTNRWPIKSLKFKWFYTSGNVIMDVASYKLGSWDPRSEGV